MPTVLLVRHGQASFGAADYDLLSDARPPPGGDRRRLPGGARLQPVPPGQRHAAAPARNGGGVRRARRAGARGRAALERVQRRRRPRPPQRLGAAPEADGAGETMTNRGFQAALEPALAEWVAHAERSPTAETWPQFSGAGSDALSELTAGLDSGETAIVVTSGGAIAAVVGTLLGAPAETFAALNRTLVNSCGDEARDRLDRHQRRLLQRPLAPRDGRPRARHLPLSAAPRRPPARRSAAPPPRPAAASTRSRPRAGRRSPSPAPAGCRSRRVPPAAAAASR